MTIFNDSLFDPTLNKIAVFLENPLPNFVVDIQGNYIHKEGFYWRLLSSLQPWCKSIGIDTHSHVRADGIAKNTIEICKNNKDKIQDKPIQIELVKIRILNKLDILTRNKYHEIIATYIKELDDLLPYSKNVFTIDTLLPTIRSPEFGFSFDQIESLMGMASAIKQDPSKYDVIIFKEGNKGNRLRHIRLIDKVSCLTLVVTQMFTVRCNVKVFHSNSVVEDIILHTKALLGEGGQKKVYFAYSLFNQSLAKKNCEDPLEFELMTYFKNHPLPGIVPVLNVLKTDKKSIFYEKCMPLTLSSILDTKLCDLIPIKLSLMQNILQGLTSIHSIECKDLEYKRRDKTYHTGPFFRFHCDIKPSNVLLDTEGNTHITDFGSAHPFKVSGTVGFRAPELVQFYEQDSTEMHQQPYRFKLATGQKSDIWSLGLLFAMILVGRTSWVVLHQSPLTCIERALKQAEKKDSDVEKKLPEPDTCNNGLKKSTAVIQDLAQIVEETFIEKPDVHKLPQKSRDKDKKMRDSAIKNLTQESINESLNKLYIESVTTNPFHAELLVNLYQLTSKMLQVDVSERIKAEQALTEFNEITSQQNMMTKQ